RKKGESHRAQGQEAGPERPAQVTWSTERVQLIRHTGLNGSPALDRSGMKKLNIALIGYGFMGRTHSNAFRKVNHFFDLDYQPVLKAVCARDGEKAKAFAAKWGYESI